jgi:hypothetical protein
MTIHAVRRLLVALRKGGILPRIADAEVFARA